MVSDEEESLNATDIRFDIVFEDLIRCLLDDVVVFLYVLLLEEEEEERVEDWEMCTED